MQNSGSLSELSLREILERMQKERATGTLKLTTDSRQATLYFLFGHLFHAVDENREGEDVVYDALGWNHGDFAFDSKAKLPAEESIKVPTAEILTRFVPAEGPVEVAAADGTPAEAPSLTGAVEEVAPEMAPSETAAEVVPLAEEEEPMPEVFAETPPPPAEPLPMEAAAVVAPEMAAAVLEGPPVRGPKRRKTDVRPGTRPPETMQLYPVPMGKAIHEGLTTGFIDFPKLLRTLRRDNLTGYVRLQSETFRGVMLFSSGAVVEAIYDSAGSVSTGKDAFEAVNGDIEEGNGTLDVIQLSPEMVTALYQLLTAPSIYEKLVARFIKADALLDFLRDAKASGAVIVRSGEQNGIVLLRDGELLGAYTSASRDISESAEKVLKLCEDPNGEIEVRGGPVPVDLPVMEPGGGPTTVPSGSNTMPVTAPVTAEPPVATDGAGDWDAKINEMASRADEVLGTRSKKVKEMLLSTPRERGSLEMTFDRISELSIMFVDPSKLTALADDMRRIADR